MNRALVVEDDASIREILVHHLQMQGWLVDATDRVAVADEMLRGTRFRVLLLDLRLPDGDGLDLLHDLRRRGDGTPTVVLTARGEVAQRVRGLSAGADDYLVKPFALSELSARIDAVLRRAASQSSAVRIGEAEVDLDARIVRRGSTEHRLLPKEAELLSYLLRHHELTHTREDLLAAVWGYENTPTTRTVDTHVFQLRQKLEPDPKSPRHLLTVPRVGYRLTR
ncbi:MAG: response regulator transcription factor [Planctomycetota bacterium]